MKSTIVTDQISENILYVSIWYKSNKRITSQVMNNKKFDDFVNFESNISLT